MIASQRSCVPEESRGRDITVSYGEQGRVPDRGTYEYDFRETSSSSHRSVVKKVVKKDFPDKDYAGAH